MRDGRAAGGGRSAHPQVQPAISARAVHRGRFELRRTRGVAEGHGTGVRTGRVFNAEMTGFILEAAKAGFDLTSWESDWIGARLFIDGLRHRQGRSIGPLEGIC